MFSRDDTNEGGTIDTQFGEAEVSYFDVAILVHEDILWFEVSINDLIFVQML